MVEVDLTDTLQSFCTEDGYECEECRTLDLDNDGIKDYDDEDVSEGGSSDDGTPIVPIVIGVIALMVIGATLYIWRKRLIKTQ